MLSALLTELAGAEKPLTPAELGRRLDVDPHRVVAMLAVLRAHGMLAPHHSGGADAGDCPGAGSCQGACPGPGECPVITVSALTPLRLVARGTAS